MVKKNILRDLHVLIPTEYEKVVFGMPFVLVCMCVHLTSEWFDGLYSYLIRKSLAIMSQYILNMNIPAPKIWDLYRWTPKHKITIFNWASASSYIFCCVKTTYGDKVNAIALMALTIRELNTREDV
jgi:hypothetical protein